MQNTHGTTSLIGRAALVALLVAPSLGAQDRWEDRDRNGRSDVRVSSRDGSDDRYDVSRRDQERRLFTWRGPVDDETRIYIRAGNVESRTITGRDASNRVRVQRDRALPRRDGTLRVELLNGRGRAYVIQQPSARNGYTAIVRVKDAQGGAGMYRLAAYFDPEETWRDNRGNGSGGVWGNGSGGVWGNDDNGGDVYSGARVFHWSGSVDGDLRITLRGNSVDYSVVSGERPRSVNAAASQVPRRDGQLLVSARQGRGSVSVIQQPSAWNNYTTVVRVMDSAGGYGYYDFDLIWR